MSPILINSTSNVIPKNNYPDEEKEEEEDTELAREERKATGRSIAIIIFLSLMCLALYHVIQKKTTILAGVLVPGLILFAYTFFVIHISNRDKKRRKQLEATTPKNNSLKLEANGSVPETAQLKKLTNITPSSSGKQFSQPMSLNTVKHPTAYDSVRSETKSIQPSRSIKNSNDLIVHGSTSTESKKNLHSKSHKQVKEFQSAHYSVENEMKKLRKIQLLDKSNRAETHHSLDNKRIKTKH